MAHSHMTQKKKKKKISLESQTTYAQRNRERGGCWRRGGQVLYLSQASKIYSSSLESKLVALPSDEKPEGDKLSGG